jgi:hypothetical protein
METPVVACEIYFSGNNRPAFVNEPGWTGLDWAGLISWTGLIEVIELVDLAV